MRGCGFLVLACALTFVSACSDRDGTVSAGPRATPTYSPEGPLSTITAGDALTRIQAAVDKAGTYRIAVVATNFVLPQWGGSDSGTVEVDSGANRARAVLFRTGEGGPYAIIWANGQTVFQRATCMEWARVPGGGTNVLAPFLLVRNDALAKLGNPSASVENGELFYRGILAPLGPVTIAVDAFTHLPRRIERRVAGSPDITWEFSDWGKKLDIPAPKASYDRGPGGNPC